MNSRNNAKTIRFRTRVYMTIAGILVTGVSVGVFNFSLFGMDPFQVLVQGVFNHLSLGFGTFYTLMNLIMLVIIVIYDRKKIGLGTLLNIFLLGYVAQGTTWLMNNTFYDVTFVGRSLFLIVALFFLCLGSACYFLSDMGVSTYDAVALIISEKRSIPFQYCRVATDMTCVCIGFLLGGKVGVATLLTAFFMGPIIAFFMRHIERVIHIVDRA